MSGRPANIHGTAIVVGTAGILFIGPSGSGKSEMAHVCLSAATASGLFARLVADDQIFLERVNGRLIARRPDSIAGQMELRGTGIVTVPSLPHACLHLAVMPGSRAGMERLPPEDERHDMGGGQSLPLLRVAREIADPLAVIADFLPFLGFRPIKGREMRSRPADFRS